ncbi:MAG: ABC transporter ATP-binding protein [Clostridia bacterium]|nr:ABC transporter ATP-binding protein [Clostridia bacterium]
MKDVLKFKNVSLTYQTANDEIKAIDDLSFSVKDGEFVSIIGPSGCGKSTILSLIAGLISPTKGTIEKSNDDVGYMLQKDELFGWRTVIKNVYLPLEIKKINDKEKKEYADHLLNKYGLKKFINSYPNELSGGMRQRVALIRTLVFNPSLLLLDEPFSALDYQTRLSVCDDVYKIIKEEKKTAILVTHDISEAISMSDKIIILSKRPCSVKNVIYTHLDGDTPFFKRESKNFTVYFNKIWNELTYEKN